MDIVNRTQSLYESPMDRGRFLNPVQRGSASYILNLMQDAGCKIQKGLSSPKIGLHEKNRTPSNLERLIADFFDKRREVFDTLNCDEVARCCISKCSV